MEIPKDGYEMLFEIMASEIFEEHNEHGYLNGFDLKEFITIGYKVIKNIKRTILN